ERYFSYRALEAEAYRRAALLTALGLQKGDRVALVLAEPHHFVLSFLGAVVGGFVPVPIYPRASFKNADGYVDTLAHIVKASGSTVLLCGAGNREVVEHLSTRDIAAPRIFDVAELFADDAVVPSFSAPSIAPSDLCFLQFTSGSTNKPKGVMVTHENLVANTTAFLGPSGLDRRDSDVGVSWLPLFHDMGLIGFVLGPLICD